MKFSWNSILVNLAVLMLLILVCGTIENENKNLQWFPLKPEQVSNLLKLVVQQQEENCDIFYVKPTKNHTEKEKESSLQEVITNTRDWVIGQSALKSDESRSNGLYQFQVKIDLDKNDVVSTSPPLSLRSFDFVHKQSSQCALVFVDLLDWRVEKPNRAVGLSDLLNTMLTSTYGSMTRKDEDRYIIVANEKSPYFDMDFVKNLKFKLIFLEAGEKARLIHCLSVCFYCNAGQPSIIDLGHEVNRLNENFIRRDLTWIFPDFTKNAFGYELQVSAQTRLVFVYSIELRSDPGDGSPRWYFKRGFGKSIVDGITSRFNYTYRVHPAMGNGGSGALLPNGTWLGSVRDIIDGRTDIAVAVALNYARYQLIGGNSFFYAWVNFIMGKPKHLYSWSAIFLPFKLYLWFLTTLALIFVIITFKILAPHEYQIEMAAFHPKSKLKSRTSTSKSHALVEQGSLDLEVTSSHSTPIVYERIPIFNRHPGEFITFTLVEQGLIYPTATPSRILCAIWLFAALIITTAYRSKLVTLMTFPTLQTLPRTFSELVDSDFKWGLESAAIGGAAHQHFRSSPSSVNRRIFAKMSLERDSRKCFNEPIKRNFACITWSTQGEYILHRNFTNPLARNPLVMSEDLSAIVGSGIAYKKRAIFRHNFDRLVDSIREMGMADRWKLMDYDKEREDHIKWLKQETGKFDRSNNNVEGNVEVLILENLKGPFYCLLAGLFLATTSFIGELANVDLMLDWVTHRMKKLYQTTRQILIPLVIINPALFAVH